MKYICPRCGEAVRQHSDDPPPKCPRCNVPILPRFLAATPHPNRVSNTRPSWLGFSIFEHSERYETVTFIGQPYMPFKAKGLMLWDVPPNAMIKAIHVGRDNEVLASTDSIPARIFTRAISYEALKRRIENGEEDFNSWIELSVCPPGNIIRITLSSPMPDAFISTQVAMWGYMVS